MGLEQGTGGRVGVVLPWREQADMTPVADVGGDRSTGLIELHGQAALDQVGGGGQSDGAGADHGDGKVVERGLGRAPCSAAGGGAGSEAVAHALDEDAAVAA